MTTLQSTLRMSLIDNVSAKARVIGGALSGISKTTGAMTAPLRGITGQILAIGGAYLSVTEGVGGSFKAAASAQEALTEIGIKSDMTGAQLEQLGQKMRSLAPAVNQSAKDLTTGVDVMISMGTAATDAAGAIPAIGKAATATRATIEDLSSASSSAMQNLGVLPAEISKMLDGMASAGNAGAFELRDMAQYFPQLTASARSLGMNGVSGVNDMAAALQIARRGAGDASTAANNLSDFMGKIVTPQTIKNFKKFGVDVTKELEKANKNGISPIEHFIKLLDQKTKGGKGELLTEIFGDKQTLDFVRPMIADFKDYIRIRDEANNASGTVDAAFQRRMQDANQKMKAFWISMENMGVAIGSRLLEPIGNAANEIANIFNTLESRFTVFDRIGYAMQGFWSGLSVDGKGDFAASARALKEFFFGVEDGSKAADQAGQVFAKFREWGSSVRELTEAIKANPIAQFFGQMAGYGFEFMVWGAGIAFLAGTVRKLASAMMLLSGASAALSAVKALGQIANLVGGGSGLVGAAGGGAAAGGAAAASGGWKATLLGLGRLGTAFAAGAGAYEFGRQTMTGDTAYKRGQALLPGVEDVAAALWRVAPQPSVPTVPTNGAIAIQDAINARAAGFGGTTNNLPGKTKDDVGYGQQPITVEMLRQANAPQGVQEVHVTNQQPPPPITIHAPITITGVSDPVAAANSAAKQMGDSVRAAREGAYSD
ncbi:hypothetical protein ASD54_04680 [Rhizobium sp. Root149]|uniref:phage tail tape measure protein n=1 Tax=Rhizobium sp. Root149 TaxID=1736473 RepID=UPI00071528F8|nr:phage tail tape measure protein [Rhizobium sp. Root149]KQZ54626.1 hypothetical protein ASD54_04680 [Rhizobium sp. Root149]